MQKNFEILSFYKGYDKVILNNQEMTIKKIANNYELRIILLILVIFYLVHCSSSREIQVPSKGISLGINGLPLRTGCTFDHKIIKLIPYNHSFEIINVGPREIFESLEDYWFIVEYENVKGCVYGLNVYTPPKYGGFASDFYFYKGKSLYDRNLFVAAIINFENSIKLNPENYKNYYYKAKSEYYLKKYFECIQDSTLSLKEGNGNLSVLNLRAECYMRRGFFTLAEIDLDFVTSQKEGEFVKYYRNLCDIKRILKRENATLICNKAIELANPIKN